MAIKLAPAEKDIGRVVNAVNELVEGRQNSVGNVTLATGVAFTGVSFPNCSRACRVFLFPQTANAAAAVPTTFIIAAEIQQNQFTIRHAISAQTDLNFSFICIGG